MLNLKEINAFELHDYHSLRENVVHPMDVKPKANSITMWAGKKHVRVHECYYNKCNNDQTPWVDYSLYKIVLIVQIICPNVSIHKDP